MDLSRLSVYASTFLTESYGTAFSQDGAGLIVMATVAAFLGTYLSSRYLKKVTLSVIRKLVGMLLGVRAVALGMGLV